MRRFGEATRAPILPDRRKGRSYRWCQRQAHGWLPKWTWLAATALFLLNVYVVVSMSLGAPAPPPVTSLCALLNTTASAAAPVVCPRLVPIGAGEAVDACRPPPLLSLDIVAAGAAGMGAYAAALEARVHSVAPEVVGVAAAALRTGIVPAPPLAAALVEARLAARLWSEIDATQRAAAAGPGGCSAAPLLAIPYPRNGFASAFGFVAGALLQAHIRGRALVFREDPPWGYAGGESCEGGGGKGEPAWACYFLPPSPCTHANSGLGLLESSGWAPSAALGNITHNAAAETAPRGPRVLLMGDEDGSFYFHGDLTALEPPAPYTPLGVAWWRTQFFAFLFRPSRRVSRLVERAYADAVGTARAPGWAAGAGGVGVGVGGRGSIPSYLAWHVRQGDKVVEFGVPAPESYVAGLSKLAKEHCVHRVFLASDSPAVIAAAPAMLAPNGLAVASLRDAARLGGSNATEAAAVARTGGRAVAFQLAVDAIANIWLLSEGSLFTGMLHSNFGRLAVDLAFAKGHLAAPVLWRGFDEDCRQPECAAYYAAAPYWRARAARIAAGLPPGLFL